MLMCVCLSAACAGGEPAAGGATAVRVFAASSLTEAFLELERSFEAQHPGVDVQLTFAGSQVLRYQIEQGAAADIYAAASEEHVQALQEQDLVASTTTFATNELVVIAPASGPQTVQTFDDLTRAERLVVGSAEVPVGAYTRRMLDRLQPTVAAAVRGRIVSEEANVRLVRAKVELGEADAAIVYRTDATDRPRLRLVEVPAAVNVVATYPLAVLGHAPSSDGAQAFVRHVLSPAGQQVLRMRGFGDAPR